jgi:hypothetical protein
MRKPPLSGFYPAPATEAARRICRRLDPVTLTRCTAHARWHVLWGIYPDGGYVSFLCNEHMALARTVFVYRARHEITADCAMPGVPWADDGCRLDPGTHHATAAEPEPAASTSSLPASSADTRRAHV